MDFKNLTLEKAHQGLKNKEFSSQELTEYFFNNIEEKDDKIRAFLLLTKKEALLSAKEVDRKIKAGEKISVLAGIPAAVKDNILVEGIKTTAGSKILENYMAPYDATVIERLKKEDFVLLGKTNLDEFAMGSSTENSSFFPTKNPLDLTKVPGGSSGGSAAAVASEMCLYALGSDTGGSIRQPAAFCGVVGLKPSYGRVSRSGLISLTSSTDVIGPLTKNVKDAALVLKIMAGLDLKDATTSEKKVDDYVADIEKKPEKIRIGRPKEYFGPELNKDIKEGIKKIIKKISEKGFEIIDISLPHTDYAVATYYIITPSEASTNLARYDGIKYGFSNFAKSKDLIETYFNSREKGLGAEPKRRIMLGTFSLSSGYYEAYYLKALKVRNLISDDFKRAFEKVDFIITPTTPTFPFALGEKQTPLEMYLSDVFLTATSLAGLPALSLPFYNKGKLPYSIQLISNYFEEKELFRLAYFLENEVLESNI